MALEQMNETTTNNKIKSTHISVIPERTLTHKVFYKINY